MTCLRNFLVAAAVLTLSTAPAGATIISVSNNLSSRGAAPLILTPMQVGNGADTNLGQQGFDELQGVLLAANLTTTQGSGGTILAGTRVDSHMIFMNIPGGPRTLHQNVVWTFSGMVLGVMSNINGSHEFASTPVLGLPGVNYPVPPFGNRGFENNNIDGAIIGGNQLTVTMRVAQPGDWIRVVTASPVPEPGAFVLLGVGLLGLGTWRRRQNK